MIRYMTLGLMLCAGPSQAMIQCIYYDQMVAESDLVVQIENAKIGEADAAGNCAISGPATQVFVGTLAAGDWVETVVACDNSEGIAGPTIWSDVASLKAAKVIELHLRAGDIAGYGAGLVLLDGLTETPAWKPLCGEE